MADRYWVGGTAAWDSTPGTKWATTSGGAGGASVPTIADAVFFNAASGAGTVTVSTGGGKASSVNCTGFTGTLAGTTTLQLYGSLTLVSGMGFTYTGQIEFNASGTLTTGGKTLRNVVVQATGGIVTLGSALTTASTSFVALSAGTLNTSTSNYSITTSYLNISTTTAKTLTLNASTVTLSRAGVSGSVIENTGSNLTVNAGTSTINLSSSTAIFDGGGFTYATVAFTSTATGSTPREVNGANTFSSLQLTAPSSVDIAEYDFSANQTIGTFVCAGSSPVNRIFLKSSSIDVRRTLSVTTWTSISDVDFQSIGLTPSRSGTRLGNCGNNSNITFAAAKTVYWNLSGTQSWSATGWATTSGGTPSATNFPLAQDTAVFDDAGAAGTVTFNQPWNIGKLDMSARTTSMTLNGAGSVSVYGDWVGSAAVTVSLTNLTTFAKVGTQTITSAGKSFYGIIAARTTTDIVLNDALTTTATSSGMSLIGSAFNANTYTVTTSTVSAPSATLNLGTGTWTITGTGNCWNCLSATVTGTAEIILSDNTTTARTFIGATGATYGKLTIGGDTSTSTTTIAGVTMTFSEIASTKNVAHTIVFPNTTTTVGNFTVRGSAGNLVTLSRTGTSGTFTLAKSGGGVVSSDYLSISNSTVTPGTNTWYAGANSTNGGLNTGWIFAAAPSIGNFIAFFM